MNGGEDTTLYAGAGGATEGGQGRARGAPALDPRRQVTSPEKDDSELHHKHGRHSLIAAVGVVPSPLQCSGSGARLIQGRRATAAPGYLLSRFQRCLIGVLSDFLP